MTVEEQLEKKLATGTWTDDDYAQAEKLGWVDTAGGAEWHRLNALRIPGLRAVGHTDYFNAVGEFIGCSRCE